MARKSAKRIVEESMPSAKIMPSVPDAGFESQDVLASKGVSIEDLKRKYLGASPSAELKGADDSSTASKRGRFSAEELRCMYLGEDKGEDSSPESSSDDVEVVRIQSNAEAEDAAPGPGVRSILVSKRDGKIIGKQG